MKGYDCLGYVGVRAEDNIETELWCEESSRLNWQSLEFIAFSYESSNEDSEIGKKRQFAEELGDFAIPETDFESRTLLLWCRTTTLHILFSNVNGSILNYYLLYFSIYNKLFSLISEYSVGWEDTVLLVCFITEILIISC